MYEYLEEKILAPADTAKDRLNNLMTLLEYLLLREASLLKHLSRHGSNWGCQAFWAQSPLPKL